MIARPTTFAKALVRLTAFERRPTNQVVDRRGEVERPSLIGFYRFTPATELLAAPLEVKSSSTRITPVDCSWDFNQRAFHALLAA
jgi:hypothetical protein